MSLSLRHIFCVILISAVVFCPSVLTPRWVAADPPGKLFTVSLPSPIKNDEQVTSFTCKVSNGYIVSWPRIPINWSVRIQNGDGGGSEVNAQLLVSVGLLKEQNFFSSFMIVEDDSIMHVQGGDFDLSCTLGIYSGLDAETSRFRKVIFHRKDIILQLVPHPSR